jgi:hypothetical protein
VYQKKIQVSVGGRMSDPEKHKPVMAIHENHIISISRHYTKCKILPDMYN